MAKNFIDEDERPASLGYIDGFRFGFGFFVAVLLGSTVLAGIGLAVYYATTQLR